MVVEKLPSDTYRIKRLLVDQGSKESVTTAHVSQMKGYYNHTESDNEESGDNKSDEENELNEELNDNKSEEERTMRKGKTRLKKRRVMRHRICSKQRTTGQSE